jgi:hypothetical protein
MRSTHRITTLLLLTLLTVELMAAVTCAAACTDHTPPASRTTSTASTACHTHADDRTSSGGSVRAPDGICAHDISIEGLPASRPAPLDRHHVLAWLTAHPMSGTDDPAPQPRPAELFAPPGSSFVESFQPLRI